MVSGIKIVLYDNGENYGLDITPLNPFEEVKPKWISALMDYLAKEKEKIVGKIDEKFYDEKYFEGESEKSGMVDYDNQSKNFAEEHAKERIDKLIFMMDCYKADPIGQENFRIVPSPKDIKIMELGCAFGHTVDVLRKMGYDAYGVDISEYAINKHKTEYKTVMDITKEDLKWDKYDLIYSFAVMEHIAEIDLRKFIHNISLNLKQKGIFFATIDNVWGRDQSHITIRPRGWWNELFLNERFSIHEEGTEKFKGINGYVFQKV